MDIGRVLPGPCCGRYVPDPDELERVLAGLGIERTHQHPEFAREPEDLRQPLVRTVLPSGRPDDLVERGEPLEHAADPVRDAVRHAVDQMEAPGGLDGGPLEAEQADDAVDVEGEDRALLLHRVQI